MNITDLKPAPFNPREIDDKSLAALKKSVNEFGDISGIVWNKRNGFLVCGHQRVKVLVDEGYTLRNQGKRTWLQWHDPNDAQQIRKFPIRVVDWSEEFHRAAMIVVNSQLVSGTYEDVRGRRIAGHTGRPERGYATRVHGRSAVVGDAPRRAGRRRC